VEFIFAQPWQGEAKVCDLGQQLPPSYGTEVAVREIGCAAVVWPDMPGLRAPLLGLDKLTKDGIFFKCYQYVVVFEVWNVTINTKAAADVVVKGMPPRCILPVWMISHFVCK